MYPIRALAAERVAARAFAANTLEPLRYRRRVGVAR